MIPPLHIACIFGNIELIKYLLYRRFDVNLIDKKGCSAIGIHAKENNIAIARLLLENGAVISFNFNNNL